MPFKVIVTKDSRQMSEAAGQVVLEDMKKFGPTDKKNYVLGLATGNTPTGMYQYLADNQDKWNSSKVLSYNLDEYVGLPGENAQMRALHPESYSYFMIQEFFGKLEKKFVRSYVPFGTLIDQEKLVAELKKLAGKKDEVEIVGADSGKAVVIKDKCSSEYLLWIKKEILDGYEKLIKKAGGINLHVVGVGGRGHVAFHESGVPLELRMLLVQLDKNTVGNAVADGHFAKVEDSPNYAISMGAGLVYEAKTVLLLANGKRKTGPIAESILGPVTADVPISYGQDYAKKGGNMVYVIDAVAAEEIFAKRKEVEARGITIEDRC